LRWLERVEARLDSMSRTDTAEEISVEIPSAQVVTQ
jgi:hypothetical protein